MCIGIANGGKIMTPQEALNKLDETVIGNLEWKIVLSYALEKQIPKKPIEKDEKDYWGNIIDSVYICSECNRFICHEIETQLEKNYPYCHCGQKIDWSNTK